MSHYHLAGETGLVVNFGTTEDIRQFSLFRGHGQRALPTGSLLVLHNELHAFVEAVKSRKQTYAQLVSVASTGLAFSSYSQLNEKPHVIMYRYSPEEQILTGNRIHPDRIEYG